MTLEDNDTTVQTYWKAGSGGGGAVGMNNWAHSRYVCTRFFFLLYEMVFSFFKVEVDTYLLQSH
jgi:hypothetical protein